MSAQKARRIIRSQMRRAISGSTGGQRAHIRRAEMIAELIYQRFQILPLHIPVKMNTFSGKREHLRFPKHCLS